MLVEGAPPFGCVANEDEVGQGEITGVHRFLHCSYMLGLLAFTKLMSLEHRLFWSIHADPDPNIRLPVCPSRITSMLGQVRSVDTGAVACFCSTSASP